MRLNRGKDGLILDSEVVEMGFVLVLSSKAGVNEVARSLLPLVQATIVEHLEFICDDKWDYAMC